VHVSASAVAKNLLIAALTIALLAVLILRRPEPAPPIGVEATDLTDEAWEYAAFGELITGALEKPGMTGAAIGLCVLDGDGDLAFDWQSRTAFIPASSLKTLTTATALEVFGPAHRIETKVCAATAPVDGVLEGDIILLGGGDPMLSSGDLRELARSVRIQGVERVTGRVIGDGRLFAGSIFDGFWNWGDIGNGYGSGVSGLNLDHNRFTATFWQGDGGIGDPAQLVGVEPEVPGVRFVNETVLADPQSGDGVVIHGGERTSQMFFRGTVPANGLNLKVTGAVPDPERFAAHFFKEYLASGTEAVGASALQEVPEAKEVLAWHQSPPLREIVRSIHYTSDNHETECLFKLLGLHFGKAPDVAIREHWAERGLEFVGLRMEDGSGLARADFITPHDLAKLQFLAGSGPQGEAYKDSLLDRDEGKLRWKGGAMSSVRSYTGYATGADGVERCFALMVNHYSDSDEVRELREAVWAALREFGG
jgi:D-alanyl-D-alanine carboxypeptidase/D-alanyl-D-alanine-endopeptidase (penicillin-binding protein 4)